MAVLETHEQHQELIDELIADVAAYNPDVDADLITRAFLFAADAHGIEPPPEAHGPQYFMLRPLRGYEATLTGRAVYPRETFGDAS